MPRAKFQTLTEQMYYILLCLHQERCGMDVMDAIPAMTGGGCGWGPGPSTTGWSQLSRRA